MNVYFTLGNTFDFSFNFSIKVLLKKTKKSKVMEKKNLTLKLNGKRLTLTVCGEKKMLDQLSLKPKQIRLFCEKAELKAITLYLFEHLQMIFTGHEFVVDDTIFVKDITQKTFLFLKNDTYALILNNNELRIPLKIHQNCESDQAFIESCDANSFPRNQWFCLD